MIIIQMNNNIYKILEFILNHIMDLAQYMMMYNKIIILMINIQMNNINNALMNNILNKLFH